MHSFAANQLASLQNNQLANLEIVNNQLANLEIPSMTDPIVWDGSLNKKNNCHHSVPPDLLHLI